MTNKEIFLSILLEEFSPDTCKLYKNHEEFCKEVYGKLLNVIKSSKNIFGDEPMISNHREFTFHNLMEQVIAHVSFRYSGFNPEAFKNVTNTIFSIYEIKDE